MTIAPAPAAPKITHYPAGRNSGAGYTLGERIQLVRDMPDRSRVIATLEIRRPDDPGRGLSPGFSLTGEVYEAHGTWNGAAQHRNGREWDIGGQVTEYLLRAFPFLTPFAAVHLADLDGTPMHALANARHFYGSSHDNAAGVLRMDPDDLPHNLEPVAFAALVEDQRERWRWEAHDALNIFNSLHAQALGA